MYRDALNDMQEKEVLFMCRSPEEKEAWRCAIAELKLLADVSCFSSLPPLFFNP